MGITETKIGYKDIIKQKEYMKLIIANVINRFGDSVDSIAFTWLVYQITHSASWSAIIFAFNMLPAVIIQPFAGALVEGMNKKKIMVVSDIIRGIVVSILVILYLTGSIKPYILILFTLINSTVEAFRVPAGKSFTPQILDEKYFTFGTSLNSTLSRIVELVGIGLAGVIIALFGVQTSIIIDAITFFLSCFIISTISVKEEKKEVVKLTVSSYLHTLKGGLDYVLKNPIIRNICLLMVMVNAIMVPVSSLQAPLIQDVFKQGSTLLSVYGMSISIGMVIGSIIYPFISKKLRARPMIVLSGMGYGIAYIILILASFISTSPWMVFPVVLLMMTVVGMSASILISVISVEFMKQVDKEYLSRTGAILNAGGSAAMPVFSLLCTILVKIFTISQIFLASGILSIILFLYILLRKIQFEKIVE
jgi:MFS family permease